MTLRVTWGFGGEGRDGRGVPTCEELRKADSTRTVVGTLACSECDAPVAIGAQTLSPSDPLTCPYCTHHGPARQFLSLEPPTRPTRVIVRIRRRPRPARVTVG
jgi:hypothetical protein